MGCLNEKTTQIIIAFIVLEKNSNSYCSSEGKNRSDKKSSASRQKVDHSLWDVCMEKTQILIAHQKERIDRTKKVRLADKKSTARD